MTEIEIDALWQKAIELGKVGKFQEALGIWQQLLDYFNSKIKQLEKGSLPLENFIEDRDLVKDNLKNTE